MIAIVLLFTTESYAQGVQEGRHIVVSMRMIRHQVLLHSGGSTSLVLPVKKENDRFRIQFEQEFELNPEELVTIVNCVIEDAKIDNGCIVEVEECGTKEIVYSYEIGNLEQVDIVPCRSIILPKGCYSILFTLNEFEIEQGPLTQIEEEKGESGLAGLKRFYYLLSGLLILFLVGVFLVLRKKQRKAETDPNVIV